MAQRPRASATYEELVAFYSSDRRTLILIAGIYLMPFAGIGFLWFAVALRMWIKTRSPEDALLSNVQLVSAIVYIGLFFVAAAAESVLAVAFDPDQPEQILAMGALFPRYGSTVLLVFAMRMAAMFVFTTSTIARRRKILPEWFISTGYVVGTFLLLSASVTPLLILVFPIWALILSGILLIKARSMPRTD